MSTEHEPVWECSWDAGGDPASGCDQPAGDDDLCDEHREAVRALTKGATDETPTDHGAAGFCTDHAQAPDERTETVARVLATWGLRSHHGECFDLEVQLGAAAAVVAALDDETARLRAEVERLRAAVEKAEARSTFVEEAAHAVMGGADKRIRRIEAERDALAATVARVEALAKDNRDRGGFGGVRLPAHVSIAALLAALHPEEPR